MVKLRGHIDEVWRQPPGRTPRNRRRPDVSQISPTLLVGEYPETADVAWLASRYRVSAIVNLQDGDDLRLKGVELEELRVRAAACGIAFRHFPIPDYDPDRLKAELGRILYSLAQLEAAGHIIYLHCNAGMNRAPTVAIAHLHTRGGLSLDEACQLIKSRRACGPYMQLLRAYFDE